MRRREFIASVGAITAWPLAVRAQQPTSREVGDVCQQRKSAVLFDHFVGKLLELRWYIKAECRGGLEVDHEIELLWPLYR